jgi:hypothetical protein
MSPHGVTIQSNSIVSQVNTRNSDVDFFPIITRVRTGPKYVGTPGTLYNLPPLETYILQKLVQHLIIGDGNKLIFY